MDDNSYIIYPARIVSFNPVEQTAIVKICAERIHNDSSSIDELELHGFINQVPVHFPQGGGWAITMPIKPGDTGSIFFSQVGYDHWLVNDTDEAGTLAGRPKPWLKRNFSHEDGFMLVGFNTLPRAIENFSSEGSEWRNSDASQSIKLEADGATITVTAPDTLNVTAATANFSGDVNIDGNLDVVGSITAADVTTTGDTVAGGISLISHTHPITGGSSAGATGTPT